LPAPHDNDHNNDHNNDHTLIGASNSLVGEPAWFDTIGSLSNGFSNADAMSPRGSSQPTSDA
jgi:hypothetical protein